MAKATSKIVDLNPRRTFEAKYANVCFNCQTRIWPGDMAFYLNGVDGIIGQDCCGDKDDEELLPSARSYADDMPATEMTVPLEQVMPRGKTHRDMCKQCFMVHSPGQGKVCD